MRDVPLQPADGARLAEAHLGLGLRQDPLHPPPARCGERLVNNYDDFINSIRSS